MTRVAIVGQTGSGKSTLLGLVPRLFDPVAGKVLIDGRDVREFTLESLRAQVSVVQQEPILFGLSVAENIRYGCPDASDEEVVRPPAPPAWRTSSSSFETGTTPS